MPRPTRVLTILVASLSLLGLQVESASAARDQIPPMLDGQRETRTSWWATSSPLLISISSAIPQDVAVAKRGRGVHREHRRRRSRGLLPTTAGSFTSLTTCGRRIPEVSHIWLLDTHTGHPSTCTRTASDYNGDFGCELCLTEGFLVTARDGNQNATTISIDERPSGRARGQRLRDYASGQPPYNGAFTYAGSWSTNNCACFLQWHTTRTSTAGSPEPHSPTRTNWATTWRSSWRRVRGGVAQRSGSRWDGGCHHRHVRDGEHEPPRRIRSG